MVKNRHVNWLYYHRLSSYDNMISDIHHHFRQIKYILVLGLSLFCSVSVAQESLVPAPADDPITATESNIDTDSGSSSSTNMVDEMVQYLDELTKNVALHEGHCVEMAKALSDWHDAHKTWIDSLDYATVNADAQTVEKIRIMAESLGKQLASCYDSQKIPKLLMQYSGY